MSEVAAASPARKRGVGRLSRRRRDEPRRNNAVPGHARRRPNVANAAPPSHKTLLRLNVLKIADRKIIQKQEVVIFRLKKKRQKARACARARKEEPFFYWNGPASLTDCPAR